LDRDRSVERPEGRARRHLKCSAKRSKGLVPNWSLHPDSKGSLRELKEKPGVQKFEYLEFPLL